MAGQPDTASLKPNVIRARHLVEGLTEAIRDGENGLKHVPGLIRAVLQEEAWRERQIRTKKIVKFERFIDFITAPPLEGLGEDPAAIKRLIHDDAETLAAFEAAIVDGHGGDRKSEKAKIKGDNVTLDSERGNGKAYTLRRLAKDRPDLFEKVKENKLTANQAAIEAGFRKVKTPLEIMATLWGKLTPQDKQAFLAMVKN